MPNENMPNHQHSIDLTQVVEWRDGEVRRQPDYLAGEEPLEIRLDGRPISVTMRTPGNDLELAVGFLFTEGVIQKRSQIASLNYAKANGSRTMGNTVEVSLRTSSKPKHVRRNFFMTSSCGICGKASIDAVRAHSLARPTRDFFLDPQVLCTLPDGLKAAQRVFDKTGGLHAAALFNNQGEMILLREDIGRHNAVDKIVGWALLEERLPLSDFALMVSGRGGFEIIQKALMASIPLVASISAPSGLAVRLARELGLTLVGFLRGRRFLVYSGEDRLRLLTAANVPVRQ